MAGSISDKSAFRRKGRQVNVKTLSGERFQGDAITAAAAAAATAGRQGGAARCSKDKRPIGRS